MKYILFVILTVTACWVITSVKKEAPAKEPTKEEKTAKESLSEEEFLLPMEKEFIEGGILFYSKCPPDGEQAQGPNRAEHRWANNVIIEKIIRLHLKKPTGTLTKSDLEKVRALNIGWPSFPQAWSSRQKLWCGRIQPFGPQLTSVECLVKLTNLKGLDLGGNKLTDVKGLEKLAQLDILTLANNQLTDVKGLEKLTQLKVLNLQDNQLTDLKGLEKLTQLTVLGLDLNPDLTKAQIDELQKALPNCKIISNPAR